LLVLQGRNSRREWCAQCGAEREMISLETTGVVPNLDEHAVEEGLNSQGLPGRQSSDGHR
jgi:hypothetical protein